jgi:hypothetical protein
VLDQNALAAAVSGCQGVFHLACPVPTDKVLDPEASATWFIALATFSFFARGSLLNLALSSSAQQLQIPLYTVQSIDVYTNIFHLCGNAVSYMLCMYLFIYLKPWIQLGWEWI